MNNDYFYSDIGRCFYLLSFSKKHKHFNASSYMSVEICPARTFSQLRIYNDSESNPVGFVTWAYVDSIVKGELVKFSRALMSDEWNCGSHLFFNDFVAPWGGVREILNELTTTIFPEEEAFSISRDKSGKVVKVHRWIGKAFSKERVG